MPLIDHAVVARGEFAHAPLSIKIAGSGLVCVVVMSGVWRQIRDRIESDRYQQRVTERTHAFNLRLLASVKWLVILGGAVAVVGLLWWLASQL